MADLKYNLPKHELPKSNTPQHTRPIQTLPSYTLPQRHQPVSKVPSTPYLPSGFRWNNSTAYANSNTNNLFVADYDDPTQINSIVDVLFAKNKLDATVELFKNMFNPLTYKDEQGRWDPQLGVFMLNSLIHAGEIMDVFANPVKGLLIGGVDGFKKSVNWDGTGRHNYYFNTGSWALDLALEVIVDPTNLVQFGAGSLVKTIMKGGSQTGETAVKKIVKNAIQRSLKVAKREVTEETVEHITTEAIEVAAKRASEDIARDKALQKLIKKAPTKVRDTIIKGNYTKKFRQNLAAYVTHKLELDGSSVTALLYLLKKDKALVDYTLDGVSIPLVRTIKNIYHTADATDRFLLKAGLTPSGVYPAYMLVKSVPAMWRGMAKQIIDKKLTSVLDSFVASDTRDALTTVREIKNELDKDTVFNKMLNTFGRGEITEQELGEKLCAEIATQVTLIKKELYNNFDKLDVNDVELIDAWVKEHIGFNNLDEYIASSISLKSIVDAEGVLRIHQLEDLRRVVNKAAARKKILLDHKAVIDAYKHAEEVYETAIKGPAEELNALNKQRNILKGTSASNTVKQTVNVGGFDISVDAIDVNAGASVRAKGMRKVQDAVDIASHPNFKDYIDSEAAKKAQVTAPKFFNKVADDAIETIRLCTTLEEVKAVLELFDKFVTKMRTYVPYDSLVKFGKDAVSGKESTVTRVYRAALETFWGEQAFNGGFERALYTNTFVQLTENNIKMALTTRAYRRYLAATAEGLTNGQRLTAIKNSVNKYIDMLLFKKNAVRIEAIPELKEILQNYSTTLREQVSNAIDNLDDSTESFATIEEALNKALHLDVSEFDDAIAKKLKEIDERALELQDVIASITPPEKPVITLPKTAQEISAKVAKDVIDSVGLADVHLRFVDSIKKSDVISGDLTKDSIELLRNSAEFKEKTSKLINLLNNFDNSLALLSLSKESVNLSDNTIEALAIKVSDAHHYLNAFAEGKTVSFEDLTSAHNTLVEVYSLYEKLFNNIDPKRLLTDYGRDNYFEPLKWLLRLNPESKGVEDRLIDFYTKHLLQTDPSVAHALGPVPIARAQLKAENADLPTLFVDSSKKAMDTFLEYINSVSPTRLSAEQVRLAADAEYLQLKGEQVSNIAAYISDENFVAAVTEMCTPGHTFHDTLQAIAFSDDTHAPLAAELLEFGENFLQYIETHDKLMQLGADGILTDYECSALRSTLEREGISQTSLLTALDSFEEELLPEIISKMQDFENYGHIWTESLSQEKILARDLAKGDNSIYAKRGITKIDHRPGSDAEFSFIVRQEELEIPEEYKGRPLVAFDAETTDTTNTAYITEAGIFDGVNKKDFIRTFETEIEADHYMPLDAALRKSYSDINDRTLRRQAFYADHVVKTPGTAVPAKEFYEDFLTQLFAKGDDTVLIGHNITAFDKPKFIAAFEEFGVDPVLIEKFKNAPILDNLIDLRRKAGYVLELDAKKVEAIASVLREHMRNLSNISALNCFFDAGIKNLGNTLKEFINTATTKAPRVSDVADVAIEGAAQSTEKVAKATRTLDELVGYASDLRAKLNAVKDAAPTTVYIKNNMLPIVSKQDIANITPETVSDDFKDFIKQVYGDDIDVDAHIRALGSDITLSKVFYNRPAAIYPWGYRYHSRANVVLDWFALSEDSFIDARTMKRCYNVGQALENLYSKLRNVPQLKEAEFVLKLREFVKELQTNHITKNIDKTTVWAQNIRTDLANPAASLAVGIKLYKQLRGSLPGDILKKYEDVIQVITFSAREQDNMKAFKIPHMVDDYADALKSIDDATDLDEALFEMELIQGANKCFTAERQITLNALKATRAFIVNERSYFSQVPKGTQHIFKNRNKVLMNKLYVNQTKRILSKSPEELQSYMVHHRAPLMFLRKDDKDLITLINQLNQNKTAYETFNIKFFETDEMFAIHFTPGTKLDYFVDDLGFHATLDGRQIDLKYDAESKLNFSDFRQHSELDALFEQMSRLTNGQSTGQLGVQLSKESIENYFALLPEELRATLKLEELTKSTMFLGFRFDTMNIGSLASRQYYNEFTASDITRLVANTNPKIVAKANDKNLMLDYILDPAMHLTKMIERFGEEAIVAKVKSGEYVVMSVMQDEKLIGKGFHGKGYRVIEFDPNNKKLWELAKDKSNGAIIIPRHMYAEFYDKLNTSLLYDNPLYKVAHRIIYLTKLGQITSVGNLFRNVIESQMKAMIDTKNALGVVKNDFKAVRDLSRYKKAVCDILKLSEIDYDKLTDKGIDVLEFATKYIDNQSEAEHLVQKFYTSLKDVLKMDKAKMFLPSNKKLYFEQINKGGMDEATFDTMHAILTESGTLGQLPAWGKYTLDLHKEKQARFAKEYADGLIGNQMLEETSAWQKAYDGMTHFGNLLMTPAQYMDQVGRVAQYLTLMDSGFVNPGSAIGRVSRTMFNSGIKTDSERLMELAIPFYSFFKHNALFWAEAVEENPWLAKLFFDYLNKIQDESQTGHVSDFEKLNNMSLQNAKLAGNLILTSSNERTVRETRISKKGNPYQVDVTKHDDQVTLKLNFPFMEAYQMASNPIGYLAGATNPAIQLALQTWVGNNPNVPKGVATMLDTYRPYNFDEGARTDLQGYTLVPFVGPVLQKWGPDGYAKEQYKETGFLGNLILPSVFGRLNRFDDVQFVNSTKQLPQYKNYQRAKSNYKKSYTAQGYTKQYSSPAKVRTAYTKTKKAKIKSYSPNYYNKYNYNQRAYSNSYNYNKKQTHYTNKTKFYPYRPPRRPRPSVYKLLYNSYGKSRVQYLGLPRTVKNTSKALRNFFSYTR